jgi:hypothetical protein
MKDSAKSLLTAKAGANSSRTRDQAATPRTHTYEVLVSLVRLIARQAARESAERRLDSLHSTSFPGAHLPPPLSASSANIFASLLKQKYFTAAHTVLVAR